MFKNKEVLWLEGEAVNVWNSEMDWKQVQGYRCDVIHHLFVPVYMNRRGIKLLSEVSLKML